MQFLNRAVNVRSRQIKLRDLLLLILRCAVISLIVCAITNLVLVSGVQRKGTTARYRATVGNFGDTPATNVRVLFPGENALQVLR